MKTIMERCIGSIRRFMSMSLRSDDRDGHDEDESFIDGLPVGIQESIVWRLSLGDRFRMSAVSKSWRQLILTMSSSDYHRMMMKKEIIPWIFLPRSSSAKAKEKSKTISFFSMSDDRVYGGFKVPEPICITPLGRGWCCCGSSRGWLLLSNQADYDPRTSLLLLNPISGETLQLPDLMTIPFSYGFLEGLPRGTNFSLSMIKRFEVSLPPADCNSSSSSQLLIAAIFRSDHDDYDIGTLGICRPNKDSEWTLFGTDPDLGIPQFRYGDILFYNGKLFVQMCYSTDDHESISNYITNICGGNHTSIFIAADYSVGLGFIYTLPEGVYTNHMTDGLDHDLPKGIAYTYLLESTHGELLEVRQSVEITPSTINRHTWAAQLLVGRDFEELDYTTMDFKVVKVHVGAGGGDHDGEQPDLEPPVLDDQVIFLASTGGSCCVPARNSPFQGNRIYFISSFAPEYQSRVQLGVFDLKEKRTEFQPIPGIIGKMPLVPPCWFTPRFSGSGSGSGRGSGSNDSDGGVDYASMYGGWYNTFDYLIRSGIITILLVILTLLCLLNC